MDAPREDPTVEVRKLYALADLWAAIERNLGKRAECVIFTPSEHPSVLVAADAQDWAATAHGLNAEAITVFDLWHVKPSGRTPIKTGLMLDVIAGELADVIRD
jgi:hypothetical protein